MSLSATDSQLCLIGCFFRAAEASSLEIGQTYRFTEALKIQEDEERIVRHGKKYDELQGFKRKHGDRGGRRQRKGGLEFEREDWESVARKREQKNLGMA